MSLPNNNRVHSAWFPDTSPPVRPLRNYARPTVRAFPAQTCMAPACDTVLDDNDTFCTRCTELYYAQGGGQS